MLLMLQMLEKPPVPGSAVLRPPRWTLAILMAFVLASPASAQAPGAGSGLAEAVGVGHKLKKIGKQDRVGWRAKLGGRLEKRLDEPVPAQGLRVSVVLAQDDLPKRPGKVRRMAIAGRQGRVFGALPKGRFAVRRRFHSLNGFTAQVDADSLDALMRHPDIAHVYLDGRVHGTLAQGAALIGAPAAHANGYTGAGVKVAVLDTGIDTNHADLVDDLAAQHCFCGGGCCPGGVDESSSAEDDQGHGSSVSGIVTSAGIQAPLGVAPDAEIVAVKVLDSANSGSFSDIAAALDWILTESAIPGSPVQGVRVVNLSLSDGVEYNSPSSGPCGNSNTADAIQLLDFAGIAVVVSSGNDGHDNGVSFPACVAEAISVGGVYDASMSSVSWPNSCTDTNITADTFVCHTNSDEILDVLAPEWRATTPRIGGGTVDFGGTSAASPFTAAQAALLFEANPALEPSDVRTLLKTHGPLVTNPDSGLSFRRTDIDLAVAAAATPSCGNGKIESGETCDDGNTADGDCCSSTCSQESDGISCDDGITCSGSDTCSAGTCQGTDLCSAGQICDPLADVCSAPPPVFRGVTKSSQSTNQISLWLATPLGTLPGDLLVAAVTLDGAHSGSLAPPAGAGWSLAALNSGANTPTLGVWWKLAGNPEPPSHQWRWLGGERAMGYLLRFTGHDPLGPIEAVNVGGGASLTPTAPAVTTTSSSSLILQIGGFDDDDIVVGQAGVTGSTTIAMDESSAGTDTCSSGAAYTIAGPGTVPAASFMLSSAEQWRTVSLAIVPTTSTGSCGNGTLEGGEECDDALANGTTLCGCAVNCTYPPAGTACSDMVACTQNESCNGLGTCQGGAPNDTLCDNLLFCDGSETCDPLNGCQPGAGLSVDDGIACTDDSCNENLDLIVNAPNDALCDNLLACDGGEICDPLSGCLAGAPVVIDDVVACTVDSCQEAPPGVLVLHTPDPSACDDGLACTADSCSELLGCEHVPIADCLAVVPVISPVARLILALLLAAVARATVARATAARATAGRVRKP